MILFSVGPVGPFSAWCDAAIARVVETGLGPVAVMDGDTPDEVAANLIRSTAPHLVIASRRPSEQLRRLLADARRPVIVAFDVPVRALYELVAVHGCDMRAATRIVADSCAAALACAGFPDAAILTVPRAQTAPSLVAEAIARGCGLRGPAAQTALSPPPDDTAPADAWWASLDPEDRALAEGALGAYLRWLRGEGLGQIVWDRKLFCRAGDPDRHAGMAIDIGDAPAPLVAGPWIALPRGRWAASVTLAVSRATAGTGFDIIICGGDEGAVLARTSIVPDGRGLGSATLLFTIAPASGLTVSFAIANTAPAPGGRLALGNAVLTPSPADGSGVPAELTTALGL